MSSPMYGSTRDYWAQLAQQQAAEQIAARDQEWQRLYAQCQRDIAYYESTGNTTLAENTRMGLAWCAERHAERIAQIEADAAQQLADIDADYAQKERDYAGALGTPWPTSTPAEPLPGGYTPAPSYGPRNVTDTPLDTPADAPEGTSIFDTLRAWFG